MDTSNPEINQLLRAWSDGEAGAVEKLIPLVYDDLRRLAQRHLNRERPDQMLQTTALVNEAYLRLADCRSADWRDRAHFFAFCARLMRNILVDAARSRHSQKRGSDSTVVQLEEALAVPAGPPVDLLAVDDVLTALSAFDARKAQIVEFRIFGGLSVQETASVLKISTDTVTRDMQLATAWMRRELSGRRIREG